MNKTRKHDAHLADLQIAIPALKRDSEHKLVGGFVEVSAKKTDTSGMNLSAATNVICCSKNDNGCHLNECSKPLLNLNYKVGCCQ